MNALSQALSRRQLLAAASAATVMADDTDEEAEARRKNKNRRGRHQRRGGKSSGRRPDIVLITADDMRGADWTVLGEVRQRIKGTWYPHFAYPTPLCGPSRATILTGQYAHNHGVLSNSPGWEAFQNEEHDTLATALSERDYVTALVGKYLNGYDGSKIPPGWDRFLSHPAPSARGARSEFERRMAAIAVDVIRSVPRNRPLFLNVNFRSPHYPHNPEEKYARANVGPVISDEDRERKRELLSVNDAVTEIARAMGPRWEEAEIFFLSDNGYLLGEHGHNGKATWWRQATCVPMQARIRGVPPGTNPLLAATIDIAPTILRAAGARMRRQVDGRPLQDAWTRERLYVTNGQQARRGRVAGDAEDSNRFRAVMTAEDIYVNEDGTLHYYRLPDEKPNLIGTLSEEERAWYEERIKRFSTCRGKTCRRLEQGK